ncbi:hypothetical protein MVI01_34520 [Myxococcus virescens]|uniref:Uncharacterized protein n=1 Tax=Myxococcus virescens TaxID=83456 RepID=A0A511HDP3_9BACT|nr:hypothetical protein MVI01_34520 [Myxococcus virescens]
MDLGLETRGCVGIHAQDEPLGISLHGALYRCADLQRGGARINRERLVLTERQANGRSVGDARRARGWQQELAIAAEIRGWARRRKQPCRTNACVLLDIHLDGLHRLLDQPAPTRGLHPTNHRRYVRHQLARHAGMGGTARGIGCMGLGGVAAGTKCTQRRQGQLPAPGGGRPGSEGLHVERLVVDFRDKRLEGPIIRHIKLEPDLRASHAGLVGWRPVELQRNAGWLRVLRLDDVELQVRRRRSVARWVENPRPERVAALFNPLELERALETREEAPAGDDFPWGQGIGDAGFLISAVLGGEDGVRVGNGHRRPRLRHQFHVDPSHSDVVLYGDTHPERAVDPD